MKTWKIEITMQVADSWVADGFDLKERTKEIGDAFSAMLPYAYENEVKVNIVFKSAPTGEALYELQTGEVPIKD